MSEELLRQYVRRCLADCNDPQRIDEQGILSMMGRAYQAGKNLDVSSLLDTWKKTWGDCENYSTMTKAKIMAWPNAETDPTYQAELRKCVDEKWRRMWNELYGHYLDQFTEKFKEEGMTEKEAKAKAQPLAQDPKNWNTADQAKWKEMSVENDTVVKGTYPQTATDPVANWTAAVVGKLSEDVAAWWKNEMTHLKTAFGFSSNTADPAVHPAELEKLLAHLADAAGGDDGAQQMIAKVAAAHGLDWIEDQPGPDGVDGIFRIAHEKLEPIIKKMISDGPPKEEETTGGEDTSATPDSAGPGGTPEPVPLTESATVIFDGDRIIRLAGV